VTGNLVGQLDQNRGEDVGEHDVELARRVLGRNRPAVAHFVGECILARDFDAGRIDIDTMGHAGSPHRGDDSQNAAPAPDIEHASISNVDSLEQSQTTTRGGMIAHPESRSGIDDHATARDLLDRFDVPRRHDQEITSHLEGTNVSSPRVADVFVDSLERPIQRNSEGVHRPSNRGTVLPHRRTQNHRSPGAVHLLDRSHPESPQQIRYPVSV